MSGRLVCRHIQGGVRIGSRECLTWLQQSSSGWHSWEVRHTIEVYCIGSTILVYDYSMRRDAEDAEESKRAHSTLS